MGGAGRKQGRDNKFLNFTVKPHKFKMLGTKNVLTHTFSSYPGFTMHMYLLKVLMLQSSYEHFT